MADTRQRYDIDLVRERTDLLAVVSQHVALKKRGGRYTGLCPFHQEKSPSFGVDPQKGFWHCFGCGKGGDAFTFVMQLEHLSFPEAVERLAERAGIRPTLAYEPPQRKEERDQLFEVNGAAALAFRKALAGRAGEAARGYLAGRGMSMEQAERFQLGYAPASWDALTKHLSGRGYSIDAMVKAGLAVPRNNGDGVYDRFRNRLMIPIHDRQGRVIAFGGRALSAEDNPKYLNTAETPVFYKSRTLYALNVAADTIVKKGRAIVTEGYFDVIACHLAGFTEAVATLGTALGEEHVQILRRLAERVYLVFDGDSAGVNAALRSQALFRQAGVDVRIVRLPASHDPDTLLRELGADVFEASLEGSLAPTTFELERLVQRHPGRDTDSRVRLFRAAAQILQPLPALERAEYAAWLVDRWQGGAHGDGVALQQAILSEVARFDRAARSKEGTPAPEAATPPAAVEAPLEREVLCLMVQNPTFAASAIPQVPVDAFSHPGYRAVYKALCDLAARDEAPDARRLVTANDRVAALIAALAVRDPLPVEGLSPQSMVERLCEEYETRRDRQPENLDDPEALKAWMARMRERKQKAAKRIYGGEE